MITPLAVQLICVGILLLMSYGFYQEYKKADPGKRKRLLVLFGVMLLITGYAFLSPYLPANTDSIDSAWRQRGVYP